MQSVRVSELDSVTSMIAIVVFFQIRVLDSQQLKNVRDGQGRGKSWPSSSWSISPCNLKRQVIDCLSSQQIQASYATSSLIYGDRG